MLGGKSFEAAVSTGGSEGEAGQVGAPEQTGEVKAGLLPELQRQLELPPWPELPQWPEVPGTQQPQAADRPAATPRQWGQPEAEAPTAASRPPGRDRTVPRLKSRIRRRMATVLCIETILSRSVGKSQGLAENNL